MAGDTTAASDAWLVVASALVELSPRQRACVVLVDYADLDATSVAEALGTAEATVRVHLMRGRRILRRKLNLPDQEIEP